MSLTISYFKINSSNITVVVLKSISIFQVLHYTHMRCDLQKKFVFLTVANSSSIQINRTASKNYPINNIIVTRMSVYTQKRNCNIGLTKKMVTYKTQLFDGLEGTGVLCRSFHQINKQKSNANLNFFWFHKQVTVVHLNITINCILTVCVKCTVLTRYDRLEVKRLTQ